MHLPKGRTVARAALAAALLTGCLCASATAATPIDVAAGGGHSCVLTAEGAVQCSGQLGNGATWSRTLPEPVVGLESGVAEIAAGWDHTCARTTAGAVVCWGEGEQGQLGNGAYDDSAVPAPVVGLGGGALAIATG